MNAMRQRDRERHQHQADEPDQVRRQHQRRAAPLGRGPPRRLAGSRAPPGGRWRRRRRARRASARRPAPRRRRRAVARRGPGPRPWCRRERAGRRRRPRRRHRPARPRPAAPSAHAEPHRLGPEAELPVRPGGRRRAQRPQRAVGRQQVHRRRADETRHERGRRPCARSRPGVPICSITPVAQHGDPVAQHQRLGLVVGDVDHGAADPRVQRLELGPRLHPQLDVQIGQRLVEQEHVGLAYQRPRQRDPLPLAAGELAGPPVEQVGAADRLGGRRGPLAAPPPWARRARSARRRCSRRRSGAGTARRTGRPWTRCAGPGRSPVTSRPAMTTRPRGRPAPARRPPAAASTCPRRTGRAPPAARRAPTSRSTPCSTSTARVAGADIRPARSPGSSRLSGHAVSPRAKSGRVCSSSCRITSSSRSPR